MATLLLAAAGSAIGGAIGGSILGFSAVAIGGFVGGIIGSQVDQRLFAQTFEQEGPRLSDLQVTSSAEGSSINRLYGRARMGGNVIWASQFTERKKTEKSGGGGKGGGGGGGTKITTYSYSISFAVAFCEGNSRVTLGRVWADGKLMDTDKIDLQFYPGSDTQPVDPTIESIEGTNNAPAYLGMTYVVFTNLQLEEYGNRIPQITAEIIKPLGEPEPDTTEDLLEGINLIPSTGEAAYATTPTVRDDGFGNSIAENLARSSAKSNIEFSMDDLDAQLPNVDKINLVIGWFGTDLRASDCEFLPKAEKIQGRRIFPNEWSVGGLTRSISITGGISTDPNYVPFSDTLAYLDPKFQVSDISPGDSNDNPAFGGTPADFSVVESIQRIGNVDQKEIYFYPFLLMDIPSGNSLPNTDGVTTGQEVYPWRGRITTSTPAVDKTAAAQTEINSLFGSVSSSDFSVSGTTVTFTGTKTDFGYRRMILHYAHLCAAAANSLTDPTKFKGFYVGTELRGITSIRSSASSAPTASTVYPGVNALVELIEDVRAIFDAAGLTGVQISYAADWSEYHSHRPSDGSDDVYFNMDAIWGHPDCDYVAVDNYMPLSDWRDGTTHEDYGEGTITAYATTGTFASSGFPQSTTIYSHDYLMGQVEGGERYDYFYLNDTNRDNQTRSKIEDTLHQEHWVFRQKDLRNWWQQQHRSRPGGTRDASVVALSNGAGGSAATWSTGSKRIVFSEFGAPAVDKGTNQPNVFFDPKSSESFLPYFSNGNRDDVIIRFYYEAVMRYWRDNSPVGMIDISEMFAWTWDTRPFPVFPYRPDIWSDSDNYQLGHWLNGRLGLLTLAQMVKEICLDSGIKEADIDVSGLINSSSVVRGFLIDNQSSYRNMLNTLAGTYLFDGFESEGKIKFRLRDQTAFSSVDFDELVVTDSNKSGFEVTTSQARELPNVSTITFIDEENDYNNGSVGGDRSIGDGSQSLTVRMPIVLDESYARSLSEIYIHESWSKRDKTTFSLPPSKLAFDPGDGISISLGDRSYELRIDGSERSEAIKFECTTHDNDIYETLNFNTRGSTEGDILVFGQTVLLIMDIPMVTGDEDYAWAPRIAAYQTPFPSTVDFYNVIGSSNVLNNQIDFPAIIGETVSDLPASDPWKFTGETLEVKLYDATESLVSYPDEELLTGNYNVLAVKTSSGTWEVIQFGNAVLTSAENGLPIYTLSRLIRGQLGTETEIETLLPAGSVFCILEIDSVFSMIIPSSQKNTELSWRFGPGGEDIAGNLFQTVTHTGQSVGLLPYAPVHLRKNFTGTGSDVKFSWVRRTRFGGDDFDQENVPLNEESESYEIEIYDSSGTTLRRTETISSPEYTYSTADQTSDGGVLNSYLIKVWQISAEVGRGREASDIL